VHTTPVGLTGDRLGSILSTSRPPNRAGGVYSVSFVGAWPSLPTARHLGALGFSQCPCLCGKLSLFSWQTRNLNGARLECHRNLQILSQLPTHDDSESSDEVPEAFPGGSLTSSPNVPEGEGDSESSRGQQARIPYGFVTALATVGFVETAYLTWGKLSGASIACTVDGSCTNVLDSSYATVFGIPLALVGMAAYGALSVIGGTQLLSRSSSEGPEEESPIRWLILGITTSMGIASLYFMYILLVKLEGASCAYCVSSAVLSLTMLLCSLRGFTTKDITKMAGLQVGVAASVILGLSIAYADADAALARAQDVDLPFVEPEVVTYSSPLTISIAKHLQSVGATMYGAFWCSHCYEQKEMFGREAMKYIDYVECYPEGYRKGVQIAKACDAANIQGFPTWVINGKVFSGEQGLEDLAKASNFDVK
jgi:uncharacterized membrane protein